MFLTATNALLCIFRIFFWPYLLKKRVYKAIIGLKMTAMARPFQRAIDECCEINNNNRKPDFRRSYAKMELGIIILSYGVRLKKIIPERLYKIEYSFLGEIFLIRNVLNIGAKALS